MVFSSLFFLYGFLPVCLLFYFLAPGLKWKNATLLVFSLFFYAWGEPIWVLLLIFSALVDYINGRIISRCFGRWQAKAALVASLVINLGMLAGFKYLGFLFDNMRLLLHVPLPAVNIALPIGISFYTFQTLSYTIDVYRQKTEVQRSFADFLLFVALFPQLIAGPILRYADIAAQLSKRRTTLNGAFYGTMRFLCGLGKKVLLANYAGAAAASILSLDPGTLPVVDAWLGMLLYAFQIYFDFSGYSDMAIGLGHVFGFTYLENFDIPYTSKSITEFWRRWHISLGSFFRDYVYIPLGGNRRFQSRNLVIVWFLTGLWHGASWNFIIWGLYFCALLMIEKFLIKGFLERLPAVLSWFYAFFFILLGWVLFYFTDLRQGLVMYASMFGLSGNALLTQRTLILTLNNLPLIAVCAVASSGIARTVARAVQARMNAPHLSKRHRDLYGLSCACFGAVMLFLCTASLVGSSYNPFLYFRF